MWLHAVSVGEVNLLAPLLKEIAQERPDWQCVISTTTMTGMALATKKYPGHSVFYCPLDFSWAVSAAMRRMRPDVLVLAELELWPNLVAARAARCPRGGDQRPAERAQFHRLSPHPAAGRPRAAADRRDRRPGRDLRPAVPRTGRRSGDGPRHRLDEVRRAQTDRDNPDHATAGRAGRLSRRRYRLAGRQHARARGAGRSGRLSPTESAIPAAAAGSRSATSRPLRGRGEDDRGSGLPCQRRSMLDHKAAAVGRDGAGAAVQLPPQQETSPFSPPPSPSPSLPPSPILLVDAVGELGAWWGTAAIGFVGGSLGNRGGQNMIEPAAYGAAVCLGPNTRNFRDIVAAMLAAEAAVVVADARRTRPLRPPLPGRARVCRRIGPPGTSVGRQPAWGDRPDAGVAGGLGRGRPCPCGHGRPHRGLTHDPFGESELCATAVSAVKGAPSTARPRRPWHTIHVRLHVPRFPPIMVRLRGQNNAHGCQGPLPPTTGESSVSQGKFLFTSEAVSGGHPDKLADQISDGMLDALLAQDPMSRVACETMVTTGMAIVAGEITTKAVIDYAGVVRKVIREVGYTDDEMGFCARHLRRDGLAGPAEPRHRHGRERRRRQRQGNRRRRPGHDVRLRLQRHARADAAAHRPGAPHPQPPDRSPPATGEVNWLRPDSKSQVTVEYDDHKPVRIDTVVVSTQHDRRRHARRKSASSSSRRSSSRCCRRNWSRARSRITSTRPAGSWSADRTATAA